MKWDPRGLNSTSEKERMTPGAGKRKHGIGHVRRREKLS